MVVFKYNKIKEAAYLSHLDTLRAIIRTIRRAEIPVSYSKGFNPHMNLYMTPPNPLGIPSECEYCTADTETDAANFLKLYNSFCLSGLKCIDAYNTVKNPNLAANITSAKYYINSGEREIMQKIKSGEPIIAEINKKNTVIKKDIREYIIDVTTVSGTVYVWLNFGNRGNLRADVFLKAVGLPENCQIIKKQMFCGDIAADDYIKQFM